jgi:hypothetical protein
MTPPAAEAIFAALDGERVILEHLRAALASSAGKNTAAEFILLRAAVSADRDDVPIEAGDRLTQQQLRPSGWHRIRSLRLPAAADLANVFVEISAARAPDERAAVVMEYDFWLVHESRTGRKTTLHQAYGSYDSAKAAFTPLTFGLDGGVSPKGTNGPVAVEVTGTLTGRIRPEGGVEVTLASEAWLRCGEGRSGGAGVKEFVANEGETVSVELPASFGKCMLPGAAVVPPGSRPGIAAVPGGLRLSSREFFEGDRFSLLVRVRRFERPPR